MEQRSTPAAAGSEQNSAAESSDSRALREQLDQMTERERRVIALLDCGSADRIEHKLRNLIHELQLMRAVVQRQDEAR